MKTIASNFAMEFSRRLRLLLSKNDINGVKLAELCGVNKSTAYDWINGVGFPKNDKLEIISRYFGVSINYLLGKDEEKEDDKQYTIPESINTFEEARDFLKSLNLYAYGGIDLNQKSENDIITLARTILSTLQIQGKL
jgi:transcriptional regulator with XRE-family HTH domain